MDQAVASDVSCKAAKGEDGVSATDILKIALETRNFEITLFWQRCNYFLVVNSALAIGFLRVADTALRIPIAILGAVVCFLWYRVALGSKYWQERWEFCLSKTEKSLRDTKQLVSDVSMFCADWHEIRDEVRESLQASKHTGIERSIDEQVLTKPSVTLSMIYLVIAFGCSWLLLLIYEAFRNL